MALHKRIMRQKTRRRMVVLGNGMRRYAFVIRVHRRDGNMVCRWGFLRADTKRQAEEHVRLCRDRLSKRRRYCDGKAPRSSSFSVYRALTQFPMRNRHMQHRTSDVGIWGDVCMVSRGIAAVRYTPRMPVYRVQYVKAFNWVTGDVINSPVTNEVAAAIRRSAIERTRLNLAKQAGCWYEDVVFVGLRASICRHLERHVKVADPVPNLRADRVMPVPPDRTTDFMVWYKCGLPDGSHHPGNALLQLYEADDPAAAVTAAHHKVHPDAIVAVETYYPDRGG